MGDYEKARIVQVSRWDPWSDAEFRQMGTAQKLLWQFIATGPHAVYGIPGLFRLTFAQVYERVGLRSETGEEVSRNAAADMANDFIRRGWMQIDNAVGLVRIPNVAADMSPQQAGRVGTLLAKIPPCALKDEHIQELMDEVSTQHAANILARQMGR